MTYTGHDWRKSCRSQKEAKLDLTLANLNFNVRCKGIDAIVARRSIVEKNCAWGVDYTGPLIGKSKKGVSLRLEILFLVNEIRLPGS